MRKIQLVVIAIATLLGVGSAQQTQSEYEPVADVKQIMELLTIPSSNGIFKVGAAEPTSDEEWAAVESSALILVESGNLLLMENRPMQNPKKKGADWMEQSRAMIKTAKLALDAAKAKDAEKVTEVSDQIYETCDGCHKSYLQR